MICISSSFFAQYGAPATFAFATAAAVVGGRPLAEATGGFFKNVREKFSQASQSEP
jgi:hypothetical protein